MGAPNFKTMDGFPLIIADTQYCKVCPECGMTCGTEAEECEECGCDLTAVEETIDEMSEEDTYRNMESAANILNQSLDFLEVSAEGGRYSGIQFHVKDENGSPEDYDEEGCEYTFGKPREEAIAAYREEVKRVREWLVEKRDEFDLVEIRLVGRFSNGEALFERVTAEETVKAA